MDFVADQLANGRKIRTLTIDDILSVPNRGTQEQVVDQQLRERVENALNSDYYFYVRHVTVSIENCNVNLEGFVFSDWDLRHVIRMPPKLAAGGVH
jgi:osmotically-inducible protein OsmY